VHDVATTVALTGKNLVFYPAEHEYWTPPGRNGGELVPNVTRVLSATGVSTDFEAIARKNPGVVEHRRDLGSAAHIDCHAFDDDDLIWESVDDQVKPFVKAWEVMRANLRATPIHRERSVFHRILHCCGTLDGVFEVGGTKRVLIDMKLGDPEDAAAHLQTAFYESAYLLEHPNDRIDERWSVQLQPGKSVPYRITNYTARPNAWRDIQKFQAVLVTYHEQAVRRRPVR
jgi:hypothetical protein